MIAHRNLIRDGYPMIRCNVTQNLPNRSLKLRLYDSLGTTYGVRDSANEAGSGLHCHSDFRQHQIRQTGSDPSFTRICQVAA
jgi:hypothetical protein